MRHPLDPTLPCAPRRTLLCSALAWAVATPLALHTLPALAEAKPAAAFDEWSESFAADWVRLSAERATMTQYFSGAEQAALDLPDDVILGIHERYARAHTLLCRSAMPGAAA